MTRSTCSFCGDAEKDLLRPVLPSGSASNLVTCRSCVHLTVRVPLAGRGAARVNTALNSGYTAWSDGRFLYLAARGELPAPRRRPIGIQPAP